MRTETVTYKIYKYNELSDVAKAKAFEWFESVRDDKNYIFTEDCEYGLKLLFPNSELQVQYSLCYSQGDGLNIFGNLYLPDIIEQVNDKLTEKELAFFKDVFKNYSAWFSMPRNNPYCYCICDRHDYTGDVACDMECDGDSRCFDQAFTKLNKYIQEYFTDLCKQYEEQGYEFFYPEDDTEFIELCEDNEWEFYEDGTFYY